MLGGCEELRDNEEKGAAGEEKKSRRQQAGWNLLESGPSTAQCRDKRATCRITAPQSLFSKRKRGTSVSVE